MERELRWIDSENNIRTTARTAEAEAHALDGRMLEMTQSMQILNCRSASPREGRIQLSGIRSLMTS
jgi:hypothetical protein